MALLVLGWRRLDRVIRALVALVVLGWERLDRVVLAPVVQLVLHQVA